jgi:hypothetical protein
MKCQLYPPLPEGLDCSWDGFRIFHGAFWGEWELRTFYYSWNGGRAEAVCAGENEGECDEEVEGHGLYVIGSTPRTDACRVGAHCGRGMR